MAPNLAANRLREERSQWRKDHPFGFHAKPELNPDNTLNMLMWKCGIPGKQGTAWESGVYPLTMKFSEEYPMKPPRCSFPAGFYHPNVFPSGTVCLSILNEEKDWKPSMGIHQVCIYNIYTCIGYKEAILPFSNLFYRYC
jgi:ubiquitin-conjugating enzyme E2 I